MSGDIETVYKWLSEFEIYFHGILKILNENPSYYTACEIALLKTAFWVVQLKNKEWNEFSGKTKAE